MALLGVVQLEYDSGIINANEVCRNESADLVLSISIF